MNIFLLRGLVREKAHWGKFVQELEEAFPSDNIITPEIQGVGQFVDIISPTNFDEMVEFMRDQYLTQIESGEECILIAMSLGGMIARLWMEKHPQDFSKCILVNTSFKGISHIHERLRPLSILNFFKIFLTPSIEKREKAIIKMVSNNDTNHDEIIKEWIEIQKKRPVKRQNFLNQMKAAMTFNPPLLKPDADLLVLAAKADRLCNYKCSVKLHKRWGGKLSINEKAGHDLPIDDSPWMINEIKTWLKEL